MCWTCQLPTRCWYGEGQTQTGASPTPHYLQNPTRTWQQVWAPSSGQVRRHIENWTWLSGHWDCYSWWWRWGEDVSDGNGYWQFWYIWAEGIGVGNDMIKRVSAARMATFSTHYFPLLGRPLFKWASSILIAITTICITSRHINQVWQKLNEWGTDQTIQWSYLGFMKTRSYSRVWSGWSDRRLW